MRPWSQGPTSPAGMGWMQLLWNAAAHPQGSPGSTEVGAHGWWDPKMSLRATSSWSSLPPPSHSFSLQGKDANWQSDLLGKEHRKGKPTDSGLAIPMQGSGTPEWRDFGGGREEHMPDLLLSGDTEPSVCPHHQGWVSPELWLPSSILCCAGDICVQTWRVTHREKTLERHWTLLKTRRYFWCFTNKRPCCLCIIFSGCPNTNRFPFSIWGKIIETHKAQAGLKTKEIKIMEL